MFNICVCFQSLTLTTLIFFIMLLFSIRFIHLYFFSIVLYSKYVRSWHAFSVYSVWTFILNACKKKYVPPGVCMYVSIKWLSTNVNIHNESIRQRKNIYRSNTQFSKDHQKIRLLGCPPTTELDNCAIEIINNKARHNLIDAKCRWRSDRLDGAWSFREPLGQTKVM